MSATSSPPTQPLADLHRRLGARFETCCGVESPALYSSEKEEYAVLRQGCGLVERPWRSHLEMFGEDRVRFLNGLVTCDVKGLEPGDGTYGFFTSVKGRILADLTVLALDDRLRLELPGGREGEIRAHLEKYVIVDRVEVRPAGETVALSLIGPTAAEVLAVAGCGEPPAAPHRHAPAEIFGTRVRAVHGPDLGVPVWTLEVAAAEAAALCDEILGVRGSAAPGPRPVGHRALERLRIEAGRPLFGRDFGGDNFPQETGLEEEAVSYTKGCYLGQEVVARIHYRGGVNRHLRGLVFAEEDPPTAELVGQPVLSQGREAGVVTSAAESADGPLGLAILHQRAEPGGSVEIADGSAEVVALPFAAEQITPQ